MLDAAASGVARLVGSHRELILMATGPDLTSVQMTNNSLVSLARLGLRKHVMIMADTYDTCERLLRSPHCYWSSRMLRATPSDSLTNRQFWKGWCVGHATPPRGFAWAAHTVSLTVAPPCPLCRVTLERAHAVLSQTALARARLRRRSLSRDRHVPPCLSREPSRRFPFYYLKKKYIADLVAAGFSVLQVDTDTVWTNDPFPMLRAMTTSSIVAMKDTALANAGIVYARPGSKTALRLLQETAWRIQLMNNWPEAVAQLVPFAKPPFYANSDDQTLLNDAIVSATIQNRTFLGSTARYEAKNRCVLAPQGPCMEGGVERQLQQRRRGLYMCVCAASHCRLPRAMRHPCTRAVHRYNPTGPDWGSLPEAKQDRLNMKLLYRRQRHSTVEVPWAPGTTTRYMRLPSWPVGENDSVALAFILLPTSLLVLQVQPLPHR